MARRGGVRLGATVASAGMALAFGAAPLAGAPSVHADAVEDAIDQIVAPFLDATTGAVDVATVFQQFVYTPLHTTVEDWISSDLGRHVGAVINTVSGSYVIGDGTPGTQADPDGGAGGWLLGDGGTGWDSTQAGVAGGNGGASGLFGNGGAGGDGGAGANGGDGGSARGLFGSGGDGGNAGDSGVGANVLPALGGAGGNGGLLGSHGAVGDYGTLTGVTPSGSSDIGTTGTWLTDDDGRVVMLHGLNQVYKVAPFEPSADGFSDDDAAFLAANGFNAVRLGVIWAGVEPEPGVIDYAYLNSIEQTVQTLAAHGIVTVLDMHQDSYSSTFWGEGAPEWATQTGGLPNPNFGFPLNYVLNPAEVHAWDAFWSNTSTPNGIGLENSYAQMWEQVANYFKDDPDVVGYEIINEPGPGSQWLPSLFGSPHFGTQELTPFYNQVTSAIRAVDPATPVFFEPANPIASEVGAIFGAPMSLGAVDYPHTVLSFHDYCTVGDINVICAPIADQLANQAQRYATQHDIPALMTEFGATNDLSNLADMMQAANHNQVGWLEWAYTGHDITSSSPNDQALVLNPNQPPVGDNVDTAKLATLAEPYPQLVAGTPNSWSFENGAFQFSYSTAMADGGGNFPAGSQTTISTPAVEYPNGYSVNVTGGQVVSVPNAPVLVIASDGSASTVNVAVNPASAS